jgi:CBS domain-containing protein
MHVEQMMTRDVACCTAETPLSEVAQMMIDNDCGAIPVVSGMEDRRLVGIVTDRDIAIRTVAKGLNPVSIEAGAIMSSPVISVAPTTSIEETLRLMEENQVRRVPVVEDDNRLVGIVAQADVALRSSDETAGKVVEEISRPNQRSAGGGGFR